MANSIDITYSNGVFTIRRGVQMVGQGRTLESALANAVEGEPPPDALFQASEVLSGIMGEIGETHGQVATHTPGS